ncbi:MAG: AI-2E family transporter [Synergistaceae bacterium]
MSFLHENKNLGKNSFEFFLFFSFFALLAFKVAFPLLAPIVWASIFAFSSRPVFKFFDKLLKFKYRSVASVLTLLFLALCVIVPLSSMLSSIASDIADFSVNKASLFNYENAHYLLMSLGTFLSWLPDSVENGISAFLSDNSAVADVLQKFASWSGKLLTSFSKGFINGVSSFIFEFVIMVMVSFFFIRDGEKIVSYIQSVTPLSDSESDYFFKKAESLTNSVIFGVLFTVAIQAVLGGLGWWFVGLPNASLFGLLMFFFGLFPAGTAVIWVPGAIFLFLTGGTKEGVMLLVWGTLVVGTVDNFLRPMLISGGSPNNEEGVPTLLIILGLFGGVIAWGFLGIFLGPLALVLFTVVLDIYRFRHLASKNS